MGRPNVRQRVVGCCWIVSWSFCSLSSPDSSVDRNKCIVNGRKRVRPFLAVGWPGCLLVRFGCLLCVQTWRMMQPHYVVLFGALKRGLWAHEHSKASPLCLRVQYARCQGVLGECVCWWWPTYHTTPILQSIPTSLVPHTIQCANTAVLMLMSLANAHRRVFLRYFWLCFGHASTTCDAPATYVVHI